MPIHFGVIAKLFHRLSDISMGDCGEAPILREALPGQEIPAVNPFSHKRLIIRLSRETENSTFLHQRKLYPVAENHAWSVCQS